MNICGGGDYQSTGEGGDGGPCGACKFLRRKCLKVCIFAPYFDSDQGTAHFAVVHRVFGASNASKLLLRIPPHRRLDEVITLCYEAMARVRDSVHGCVGHIFCSAAGTFNMLVNLQAELAYIQARKSTLHRSSLLLPLPLPSLPSSNFRPSSELVQTSWFDMSQLEEMSMERDSFHDQEDHFIDEDEGDELHSLAREYVRRHFPGVRYRPPCSK